MKNRRALITGITGQDGSYLAEHLLKLGYEVHGLVRRVALQDPDVRMERILHLRDRLHLHAGSLESFPALSRLFHDTPFDECYHMAAQTFVAESFLDGHSTMAINIAGTHYLLTTIHELQPGCRFFYAASAEMFGLVQEIPQTETTPFYPRSPYAISKVAGFHLVRNFREAYKMFCCSAILFNHESPRRGFEFVTRRITDAVARIYLGLSDHILLGNLEAKRDWGHSREYVQAMHAMLQTDEPHDFVLATGKSHSVAEFCEAAFEEVGLDYREYVRKDASLRRPAEVDKLRGDASKARQQLGFDPKIGIRELAIEMVRADLDRLGGRSSDEV